METIVLFVIMNACIPMRKTIGGFDDGNIQKLFLNNIEKNRLDFCYDQLA